MLKTMSPAYAKIRNDRLEKEEISLRAAETWEALLQSAERSRKMRQEKKSQKAEVHRWNLGYWLEKVKGIIR